VILAVVITPPAVMLGGKHGRSLLRSTILIPLYVYPAPGAWEPLYTALKNHPSLDFTVVVNPSNGPGLGAGPDANYTRELPRLNTFSNVRTVGYVSTDYLARDPGAILRDIEVYSAWSENATVHNMGVKGIFLDETPAIYDDDSAEALESVAASIRSATGFGSNSLIVHNPGMIPDARYMEFSNLSVVFEGTYSTYQIYGFSKTISRFLDAGDIDPESAAVIIHSLPSEIWEADQLGLLRQVKSLVGNVFVTGLAADYYASFWEGWEEFVGRMDR